MLFYYYYDYEDKETNYDMITSYRNFIVFEKNTTTFSNGFHPTIIVYLSLRLAMLLQYFVALWVMEMTKITNCCIIAEKSLFIGALNNRIVSRLTLISDVRYRE